MTREQADKLLAAVDREDARLDFGPARILLATFAGMRQGEVMGLQWPDLDLERGIARVRRTRSKGKYLHGAGCDQSKHYPSKCNDRIICPVSTSPKSRAGRRDVPLVPPVVAALKEQRRRVMARKLRLGTAWLSDEDWVFPGEIGETPDVVADGMRWRGLVRSTLGMDAETGTHAARRHAATAFAEFGVDLAITLAVFGWTRADLAHVVYPRVSEDHIIAEAKRVWQSESATEEVAEEAAAR